MNRRTGVTLTEVLIAIFILAIGLMSILALFPLGAAQMAQALQHQRAAEAAANAGAWLRMIWKDACASLPNSLDFYDTTAPASAITTNPPPYKPASVQRFVYALDDPNLNNRYEKFGTGQRPYALPASVTSVQLPGEDKYFVTPNFPDMVRIPDGLPKEEAERTHSSYPVYVDSVGWEANRGQAAQMLWVGHPAIGTPIAQPTTRNGQSVLKMGAIPRRPLYVRNPTASVGPPNDWVVLGPEPETVLLAPAVANRQRIFARFSLLDDLGYNFNGTPDLDGNPATLADDNRHAVQRQGRYTWAYLYRRQNNNKSNRSNVEATAVVYGGRSIDVPSPEVAYFAEVGWNKLNPSGTYDPRLVTIDLQSATIPVPSFGNYTNPNVGKPKPALRPGSWVLDATIFDGRGIPQGQGYFYRVINVDDTNPSVITLELQTDIRYQRSTAPAAYVSGFGSVQWEARVFIVLENVIEVFPKGIITNDSPPGDYRPDDLQRIINP